MLFILCGHFLWPIFNNVFTTNISYNFATTSPSFALNSVSINSPIYCAHFAPLLVKSHCLLAFICWLASWIISTNCTNELICVGNATNKNFDPSTTTKNYTIFILNALVRINKLWTSLQMVIWPVIHLATSAASGYMLTTENDLPYNYWLEQLYVMFQLTWKCLQLRLFTGNFATYIFQISPWLANQLRHFLVIRIPRVPTIHTIIFFT